MNEDIITALKNGISRGEPLDHSKKILINSGYNSREVEEASKYVSSGVTSTLEIKPEEHLIMPEKKSLFKKTPSTKPSKVPPNQEIHQIKKEVTQRPEIHQLPPIIHSQKKPKKSYWIKEIILLIILIILLGALGASILFKDKLMGLFGFGLVMI
jgi:hypothetical protein